VALTPDRLAVFHSFVVTGPTRDRYCGVDGPERDDKRTAVVDELRFAIGMVDDDDPPALAHRSRVGQIAAHAGDDRLGPLGEAHRPATRRDLAAHRARFATTGPRSALRGVRRSSLISVHPRAAKRVLGLYSSAKGYRGSVALRVSDGKWRALLPCVSNWLGVTSAIFCRARQPTADRLLPSAHGRGQSSALLGKHRSRFQRLQRSLPQPAVAISFSFPGPADYRRGIIGDLGNLPAFRGGVALGPMLEDKFGIPVFINNDGALFVHGEAIAGFLPHVNQLLNGAGSSLRYRSLFGVTLGTGLGGGTSIDGKMLIGDNSIAGQAWLLRNKLVPGINAEEGASIRAVRSVYAQCARLPFVQAPESKTIFDIGIGLTAGNRSAAIETFRRLAEVAGDVMAQALTLIDGLGVVGGGISDAHPLFLSALVDAVNGVYDSGQRRLSARAYNIEDPSQRAQFLGGEPREVTIPGTSRTLIYDSLARTAIGISRLGTSEAVEIGAYAFALGHL
jgi:glucokinase